MGRWKVPGSASARLVAAAAALAVAHQLLFRGWWIDDAAITFSYARNLVNGDGLVPWPGGERVEGYSDPTWLLLIAAGLAVGLDPFVWAKLLGAAFAVVTVLLVGRLAADLAEEADAPATSLAPVLLAGSAQFAIWSASGLENGLFGMLLVAGILGLLRELRTGGPPWSGLAFLALVWTRPEGAMYAVVALAWGILASRRRGPWPMARWSLVVIVPSVALEALRIGYFAWPLPNTYYAKIGVVDGMLLAWNERGWTQLRAWADTANSQAVSLPGGPGLWGGLLLPVYLAGALGLRGWRGRAALGITGLVWLVLLVPGPDWLQALPWWPGFGLDPTLPAPPREAPMRGWIHARIALLGLLAVGVPLLGAWRTPDERRVARGLVAHAFVAGLLFSVQVGGDWMRGFRWMSHLAPLGAVLLAVGAAEVASAVERRLGRDRYAGSPWGAAGWLAAAVAIGAILAPNIKHSLWFARTLDVSPESIRLRVDFTTSVARRLMHREPPVMADMDMGASLWWSEQRYVDMAGLVDVPMSRHGYEMRSFVQEYVFDERRPDFFHAHQWWGELSGFSTYDAWSDYVELPPYSDPDEPRGQHAGIWVRRSMFMDSGWAGKPGRAASFPGGLVLEGWEIRSPEAADALYLEVGLRYVGAPEAGPTAVVAFAARGDQVVTWDVPLGYKYLPAGQWRPEEVFHGRFALRLPASSAPGDWDLGFAVIGPDGAVLVPDAGSAADPVYAIGEVIFPAAFRVVTPDAALAAAQADRDASLRLAGAGDCAAAEDAWWDAVAHRPADRRYARQAPVRSLAECWAAAGSRLDGAAQVDALARAHRWDHRSPGLAAVGGPVAARLYAEGLAAREAGDWELAYARFRDTLAIEPWRAWARRYAEEARDHRLGLVGVERKPWAKPPMRGPSKVRAKAPPAR